MRNYLIAVVLLLTSLSASAQVRAVGLRAGYGAEVSYQHSFAYPNFMELDLGLDFAGAQGFKLTGTYNWVVANPSWTTEGEWSIYLGPGASVGYVYDNRHSPHSDKAEFMVAFVVQFGIEYCVWHHLALSLDTRPLIGYHFGSGDFYRAGLRGFIPSLAVRYMF